MTAPARCSGHAPCWRTVLAALTSSGEAAELRTRAGIRQVTMASALGITTGTMSLIERGATRPGQALGPRYLKILRGLARHEEACPAQTLEAP